MPRYVTLINWTDQGVKGYKDTVDRYAAVQQAGSALGVKFADIYWTIGAYDLVGVVEAPDEESLAAVLLMAGAQGNVRTTTMRAFDAEEFRGVIARTS
jgi:uncharacterized protein with GYD domain